MSGCNNGLPNCITPLPMDASGKMSDYEFLCWIQASIKNLYNLVKPCYPNSYFVTPQQFGGNANGVCDCGKAIIKAINSGSPIVYFPKGEYVINEVNGDSLFLDTAIPMSNINNIMLIGDGLNSVIKAGNMKSGALHMLNMKNCNYITIANLTIDGGMDYSSGYQSSDYECHGIRLDSCNNVIIDNVYVKNTSGYGIGYQKGSFINLRINNCNIQYTGKDGIDIKNMNNSNVGLIISNTQVINPAQLISDNQYAQCGIDVRCPGSVIEGCVVRFTTGMEYGNGIRLRVTTEEQGNGGQYSTISGCSVMGVTSLENSYAYMLDDNGCLLSGCTSQRIRGVSITGNFANVSGVTITQPNRYGIYNNGKYSVFSNSVITSPTDSNSYGVYLDTDSDYISVIGVVLSGAFNTAFYNNGHTYLTNGYARNYTALTGGNTTNLNVVNSYPFT